MMRKIKRFGAFWYDFVVGDDWRIAVGVAAALAITIAVSKTTSDGWWILPTSVALLLPYSLWRTVRGSGDSEEQSPDR
jgi:hypothetical protein